MHDLSENKYRAAVQILQKGRDVLVDSLADDVIAQAEDLLDGGFHFNEFLEAQGTRLHFLGLIVSQLEQSADVYEGASIDFEPLPPPAAKPVRKRKSRSKKLSQQASTEIKPDDA